MHFRRKRISRARSAGTNPGEMTDSVIMIAGEPEKMLHPETQRNLGIGIMPADHQNERVNKEKPVNERGQRKLSIAGNEDRYADEDGKDFHPPGGTLRRVQPQRINAAIPRPSSRAGSSRDWRGVEIRG